MIENHILLFLRKALIIFPFLLGLAFVITPQVAISAALETAEYEIDPYPLQPAISDNLFLNIKEVGACPDIFKISLNKQFIDPVNKQIKISLHFSPFSGGVGCPSPDEFRVQVYDNLSILGNYQVLVYKENFKSASFFEAQKLLGSFNVTVGSTNNSIPTLSEWMILFLGVMLLTLALRNLASSPKLSCNNNREL